MTIPRSGTSAGHPASHAESFPGEIFALSELFLGRPALKLTDEQRDQRFWMAFLYAAVLGYFAVGSVVLAYALATWEQPDRWWIVAVSVNSILWGFVSLFWRYRIVSLRHRLFFYTLWNFLSFASLAAVTIVDGGVGSPLMFLYWLPMIYLALGYPPAAVLACGLGGLLLFGIIALLSPVPGSTLTACVYLVGLLLAWVLALSGAVNRRRKDEETQALRQHLEILAITDDLTGCLNQRAFTQALDEAIKQAESLRHSIALLAIDVDHFKHINDEYGHLMGDETLRRIGEAIRAMARPDDIAGRPGGDELALLAPRTDATGAQELADHLRQAIQTLALPFPITLSIGIDVLAPRNEPAAALFRRADQALYEAKRRGRNQTVVYGNSQQSTTTETAATEASPTPTPLGI